MKHILPKLLSALLVAALLLSPVALMEEEIDEIEAVEAVEPVDEIVEEQSVDIYGDNDDVMLGEDDVYTYSAETYDAAPGDALYAASGEIPIDAAHFPDAEFRNIIKSSGADANANGSLSASEIANVKSIALNSGVKDLTGIKYFTSLEELGAGDASVASLDVSGMTHLTQLSPPKTVKNLNISGCTGLPGTSLMGMSGELYLWNYSQLTTLNASGCTGLVNLMCADCSLTSLDVSGCTNLTGLHCDRNKLTSLNVKDCAKLNNLACSENQLTSLDVGGLTSLEKLSCNGNLLTSLDVSGKTYLKELYCHKNNLSSLNVSGCANLIQINCEQNQLASLNVSGLGKLEYLTCSNNKLNASSLILNGCVSLYGLDCSNNQFTSLNVNGFSKLSILNCSYNQLTSSTLKFNNCTNLAQLTCTGNKLTTLDVSGLKALFVLSCGKNKIKKLNIGNCPLLVKCYNKGTHTTANGMQNYARDVGWDHHILEYDSGVSLTTKAGKSSSSSSAKTKLASKKLKVTAYVGTPVQMETNGETGKSFKSSNKKIATVNSKGVVTPKKAGKCKITYKTASASYTVTVTVKDLTIPKYVVLNLKGTIAAKVGEPQTLTATMNDGAVSKLKWTTSNKKIATVKNGVVKFKKKGTVTITVTTVKGKKKAKVKFKVTK